MKKTSLVIMAAGIGSRFGKGIKQLTPVGPNGELIMDYSVADAVRAGFDKTVFILRKDIFEEFRGVEGKRLERLTDVEYVFQELDDLPQGFARPPERTKPWGTGQAVLCCRGVVNEPFAVINADDYYGKEPYRMLHDFLTGDHEGAEGINEMCCAGFRLGNTLSDNGGVTRGLCNISENGYLKGIDETRNIVKTADGAAVIRKNEDGSETHIPLDPETKTSMNMWGFMPEFIDLLEDGFTGFLKNIKEGDITSEFLLPIFVDDLLKAKKARVKVLPTDEIWFGVTYQEDKAAVVEAFKHIM